MYGIILATALTSGTAVADFGFKHKGCYACSCSCSCYSCYGGYGCYGCSCYCSGCHGCWTTCGCYGCYGYCGGWSCCSCSCTSYYGCGGCYGCYGCTSPVIYAPAYGCVGCAVPAVVPSHGPVIEGTIISSDTTNRPATVVVKADKEVKIKVNGQATPRRSNEDSYQSPALIPGRSYSYTVVAEVTREGKTQTETKEILVSAGRSTVVDFSTLGATAKAETEMAPASVTVVLPANAKLTVNDVIVNAAGKQTFQTPKLEKGKSYFYTVKAEVVRNGKPVTETRRIDVTAGKTVTVDFTNPTLTASR